MSLAVKIQVVINQRGLAPDGRPLDALIAGVHFDHRPPLHERDYDSDRDDTIPAANDVAHIVALPADHHRKLSCADRSRMCKTERQRARELEFRARVKGKLPGKKRKAKGTIRGRASLRRMT